MSQQQEDPTEAHIQRVLDDLAREFRDQLLVEARQLSARSAGLERISVRDLLEAYTALVRPPSPRLNLRKSSLDRLLTLYAASGLVIALAGVMFLGVRLLNFQEDPSLTIAGIAAFAGMTLSVMSVALARLRQRIPARPGSLSSPSDVQNPSPGRFVSQWIEFEQMARRLAASYGEKEEEAPLSSVIGTLAKAGVFMDEDLGLVTHLLNLRNSILHKGVEPKDEELEQSNLLLLRLRDVLRARLPHDKSGGVIH
jgi:hypothetical protein